jgi:hypothetical protein
MPFPANYLLGFTRLLTTILNVAGRRSSKYDGEAYTDIYTLEQQDGDGIEVDLPMTRSDIANYLGLTIETVSRTLTKLKQDGLIVLPTPNRIKIRHRDLLEELAAGDSDTKTYACTSRF